MVTRSTSFGPTTVTADSKTKIGSAYSFPNSGVISSARVTFYNGVTDKADNGILYLDFKRLSGPFEFAVGGQTSLATTSGAQGNKPTEVIPLNIPYKVGEEVTVSLKAAEALEEVTVSLTLIER